MMTPGEVGGTSQCYVDMCGELPTMPEGFLLVADEPQLEAWPFPPWLYPNWIVVRFNDCAVRWPDVKGADKVLPTDPPKPPLVVRRERVFTFDGGASTSATCSANLGRNMTDSDVMLMGGDTCDAPMLHVNGKRMSTVTAAALWLYNNYPAAAIVIAGLSHRTADIDPNHNEWEYESRLLSAMEVSRRFLLINDDSEINSQKTKKYLRAKAEARVSDMSMPVKQHSRRGSALSLSP